MLSIGKAPVRIKDNGVNVLLVLRKDSIYEKDGSNAYLPQWGISNAAYYNDHLNEFEGYIDLEDCILPKWVNYP
jgi:hypothetical protein